MDTLPNILIAEEDISLRRTLTLIFHRKGYCVTSTVPNLKALELLEEGLFDLVVIDIHKTDDRGLSLFFKIKKRYPQLPVIVLSSEPECGVVPYMNEETTWVRITKPFEPSFLLQTAHEFIGAAAMT